MLSFFFHSFIEPIRHLPPVHISCLLPLGHLAQRTTARPASTLCFRSSRKFINLKLGVRHFIFGACTFLENISLCSLAADFTLPSIIYLSSRFVFLGHLFVSRSRYPSFGFQFYFFYADVPPPPFHINLLCSFSSFLPSALILFACLAILMNWLSPLSSFFTRSFEPYVTSLIFLSACPGHRRSTAHWSLPLVILSLSTRPPSIGAS